MRRTTTKLSGRRLERFLLTFFQSQPDIAPNQARQLTGAAAHLFASVRLRRRSAMTRAAQHPAASELSQQPTSGSADARPASAPVGTPKAPPPSVMASTADDRYAKIAQSLKDIVPPSQPEPQRQGPPAFDPYAFGLVPTYQRGGRDGLHAKLAEITDISDLRKLARAQQIILPIELRSGDADVDDVREGIVSAVEKRIADRRAAAG